MVLLKKAIDRQALVLFYCHRLDVRLTAYGCSAIFNRPKRGEGQRKRSYCVTQANGRRTVEFGQFRPIQCEGCYFGAANQHIFNLNKAMSEDAVTLARIDAVLKDIKRLIQRHHPDKGGDAEFFKELLKRQKEMKRARNLLVS